MSYEKIPVPLDGLEAALAARPLAFTVMRECVLLDDERTPREPMVAKHLERCDGDTGRVEALLNRRFLLPILRELTGHPIGIWDTTVDVCDALGRAALQYADQLDEALLGTFPDRDFELEVVGTDDPCEEPSEVGVTFRREAQDPDGG